MNDFAVPGVAAKQGRRQEPCSTAASSTVAEQMPSLSCRRPPSVRDSDGETAKPILGSPKATI
jgi:hypothetical protein